MPPKSDPRREEARRLYLDSRGEKSLQKIADELSLSKSTVACWKMRDDWAAQLEEKNAKKRLRTPDKPIANTRRTLGYYGNKNAAGKRADVSRFKGNHNATSTGLYEAIKYQYMDDDERQLMQVIDDDPIRLQTQLIAELEVRERRMYARIAKLKQEAADDVNGMVNDIVTATTGKKDVRATKKKRSLLDKVQDIEAALSVVQRQRQNAINALHRMYVDQHNITRQDELDLKKQQQEEAEQYEDDGFDKAFEGLPEQIASIIHDEPAGMMPEAEDIPQNGGDHE